MDSPKYSLAKYISGIVKEYTDRTPLHVLNSTHFVELISTITTDLLISFDVTSLFTKMPIPDSVSMIEQLLEHNKKSLDLASLIDKCLTSTCFVFQGKFFKRISEAAMGLQLSPVVTNTFMESSKSVALQNQHLKPKHGLSM
ncbi:hypothetical protein Trydic_g11046 [Trypoxylus dichotomus]